MRLLVLTTSFPSDDYPASGIYVRRMLDNLPADIQTTVLTPAWDRKRCLPSSDRLFKCISFRYAFYSWQVLAHRPGGIPAGLKRGPQAWLVLPTFVSGMLWAALRHGRRADIIHAHWSFCGVVAGLAGRWTGTPVVTALLGTDVQWATRHLLFRKMIQWCARLNERVVTLGSAMADQVAAWVPARRNQIRVISNGVDLAAAPVRAGAGGETCYTLIVVGNLIALKQVDLVIRAVAALTDKIPGISLCIVGKGPETGRLQALVHALEMEARVTFAGQLPPDKVAAQMARSGMLVLASASEGRPNVVLEAMAAGVPVVASKIPGVQELIAHEERGLLFPPGDAARLAICIERLVKDPAVGRRLAANAHRWLAAQQLTWENMARRYAALYREVVSLNDERHRKSRHNTKR